MSETIFYILKVKSGITLYFFAPPYLQKKNRICAYGRKIRFFLQMEGGNNFFL